MRSFMLPVFVLSTSLVAALPATAAASCPPLLNYSFPSLQDQKPQSLCQWQDEVLLVVNTASYCGFTYLIDRSGTRVLSFGSGVKPDDRELVARIDEFLGK